MRCTYCGAATHTVENCPKTWGGQGARQAMRCSYCGGRDHVHAACPKITAPHNRRPDDFVAD